MSDKTQQKPTDMEISQERNRYFTGKYMTARDFKAEQDYFLSHQRSHIRMLHGWGVLCGLGVKKEERSNCERWLTVNPGVAFDCFGREIDVKEEQRVWLPIPSRRPANTPTGTKYDSKDDEEAKQHLSDKDGNATYEEIYNKPFFVCLQYSETYIEQVTALTSDNCDPAYKEANRVREGYRTVFKLKEKIGGDLWKEKDNHSKTHYHNDCNNEDDGASRRCFDFHCDCDTLLVPIALITPFVDDDGYLIETLKNTSNVTTAERTWFMIETQGRYKLPTPPQYLTHIAHINWPHGGSINLSELRKHDRKLKVWFDRKLWKPDPEIITGSEITIRQEFTEHGEKFEFMKREFSIPYEVDDPRCGINSFTFQVRVSDIGDDIKVLRFEEDTPPHIEGKNDNIAVYKIDEDYITERFGNLGGCTVYITLKCDFILDCHGNAVDGNHLGGSLPSGDGIEGGTFESWFYVIDDEYELRSKKGRRSQNKGSAQS